MIHTLKPVRSQRLQVDFHWLDELGMKGMSEFLQMVEEFQPMDSVLLLAVCPSKACPQKHTLIFAWSSFSSKAERKWYSRCIYESIHRELFRRLFISSKLISLWCFYNLKGPNMLRKKGEMRACVLRSYISNFTNARENLMWYYKT